MQNNNDRHISEDMMRVMPYAEAKIHFASRGKIFNLVDGDFMADDLEQQATQSLAQRSDFWTYETDTSTGATVSPVYVNYQPTYAHAIDVEQVSPARLAYINRQASKKRMSLVDYAAGKRDVLGWRCESTWTAYRFGLHCLERYWQRSRMGNGKNTFKDFPTDTTTWLHQHSQPKDDHHKIRRQYIPYEDGVFVAEILLSPTYTITQDHTGARTLTWGSRLPQGLVPTANCITFLHHDDLSQYQRRMVRAIEQRDRDTYEQLLANDRRASHKLIGAEG